MFKHLVVMYKMVTLEYFMDYMQEWEVAELYGMMGYADANMWDAARMLLSPHVDRKKVKDIKKIIKFPWDRDESQKDTSMSNKDRDRLKAMSEKYLKLQESTEDVSTVKHQTNT